MTGCPPGERGGSERVRLRAALAGRHAPLRLFTVVYQGLWAAIKFMKIIGVSSRPGREQALPLLSHTD